MHEIHQLYPDLIIEFIHRDYVERALASCPEHFTLRKVSRNCSEYSCVQGQRETDRKTETERKEGEKGGRRGGRLVCRAGNRNSYLGESKKGTFPLLRCVLREQGLAVWCTLGKSDLDPIVMQKSACIYMHVHTREMAASPSSANSRIRHLNKGIGSHQEE